MPRGMFPTFNMPQKPCTAEEIRELCREAGMEPKQLKELQLPGSCCHGQLGLIVVLADPRVWTLTYEKFDEVPEEPFFWYYQSKKVKQVHWNTKRSLPFLGGPPATFKWYVQYSTVATPRELSVFVLDTNVNDMGDRKH